MSSQIDIEFCKAAVALGFIDTGTLAKCLQYQKKSTSSGRSVSIVDLLVHNKYLNESQVNMIQQKKFGRYRIVQEIGRGGMGRVYKAYDPNLDRLVAIKMLIAGEISSEKDIERFLREARAIARLHHPNIVTVYDIGCEDRQHFFSMDFIDGASLDNMIKKTTLSIRRVVEIMSQVGQAIHYAHSQGIIHRDLKPANIMIAKDNVPKVMDFGVAKVISDSKKLSQSGMILGTLQYMPPEQAEGKMREIDAQSDVYALGAILYQALTNRPPFIGNSFAVVFEQILNQDPTPPTELRPSIPRELESICLKALEKRKQDRYRSAQDFVDDLNRFIRGEVVQARPLGWRRRFWQKTRQHRKIAILSAFLLFGCIATTIGISASMYVDRLERHSQELRALQEQQQLIDRVIEQTYAFLKQAPQSNIKQIQDLHRISIHEDEEIKKALKRYAALRLELEKLLAAHPQHPHLQKCLYQVQKQIGLLALGRGNYIWSEMSFERCKSLGNAEEAEQLIAITRQRESEISDSQIKRIKEIMYSLKTAAPEEGIVDEYVTEIIQMQGKHVVRELLLYLQSDNEWQRMVAIQAIGKLGDCHVRHQDKDVVELLMEKLVSLKTSSSQEVQDIIWALGRLKDPRASKLVHEIRWEAGPDSRLFSATRAPAAWIPNPSDQGNDQFLSSDEFDKRGLKKFEDGDITGAIADFEAAIRSNPKNIDAYNHLGISYSSLGKINESINLYNKAIELDPKSAKAYTNRAVSYLQKQLPYDALQDLEKSIQLEPGHSNAYTNRGLVFLTLGRLKEAEESLNAAIRINPEDDMAYNNRAALKLKAGDAQGAFRDCTEAIRLNPKEVKAYLNRALIYREWGNIAGAMADCTEAIRQIPRHPGPYFSRALLKHQQRDVRGAIKDLDQAIQLDPNNDKFYYYRGRYSISLGYAEKALVDFSQAIRCNPKMAEAYYHRGMIYVNMNRPENAVPDLRSFLELAPNTPEAAQVRGYLQQLGLMQNRNQ